MPAWVHLLFWLVISIILGNIAAAYMDVGLAWIVGSAFYYLMTRKVWAIVNDAWSRPRRRW